MGSKWLIGLCTLAAFPAMAQIITGRISGPPALRASIPSPRFQLRDALSVSISGSHSGFSSRGGPTYQVAHRYFFDQANHTYFGYDAVIQPDTQGGGYRVGFYELSIGPLDFANPMGDPPDPSQWTRQPMPPLPAPRVMQAGDTAEITVSEDPATGRKVVDSMSLVLPPQGMLGGVIRSVATMNPVPAANLAPPTVSGEAREFSVEDAELHIQRARLMVNGDTEDFAAIARPVSGQLIWLYVPKHGRYVLSISPRVDLGFVKAGEVRGGVLTFTVDKDQVRLESPAAIAPGDAPYILYVLHDAEWSPTSDRQGASPLLGSVSARELAALNRK